MSSVRPSFSALVALCFAFFVVFGVVVEGAPQNNNGRGRGRNRNGGNRNNNNNNGNRNGNGNTAQLTAQEKAAQVPDGISTATDGSTILDTTVNVK